MTHFLQDISQIGGVNEENESEYYTEVNQILSQVEIYDKVWYVRHAPENGKHSEEAVILDKETDSYRGICEEKFFWMQ